MQLYSHNIKLYTVYIILGQQLYSHYIHRKKTTGYPMVNISHGIFNIVITYSGNISSYISITSYIVLYIYQTLYLHMYLI